ncbi:MAG: T9SS type A sorting domain-containing protein [Bacteroidetes bacterium]|nr:T9SS type A sorting domain-containing protein [Bacteroidota bacterium]
MIITAQDVKLISEKNWNVCYPNTPHYPEEESLDQTIQLYLGLSLLVNFISPSETYNGINIKEHAKKALLRLCVWPALTNFIIKNPVNLLCPFGQHPTSYGTIDQCSDGGAIAIQIAPGMTQGLLNINANWAPGAQAADLLFLNSTSLIHWPLFQYSKYVTTPLCTDFHQSFRTFAPTTFETFAKIWTIAGISVSRRYILKQSARCDLRFPHLPLIYRILHGGAMYDPENPPYNNVPTISYGYKELLDKAPNCGPYRYDLGGGNFTSYDYQWSHNDRLASAYKRNRDNNSDFNGLDYMLIFNLYLLNDGSYPSFYWNPYYASEFNHSFPTAANYGSFSQPAYYKFLEYLSTRSILEYNADVTYRCAKDIDLLPGFESKLGAIFLGYIEDYSCCGNALGEFSDNHGLEKNGEHLYYNNNNLDSGYVANEIPQDTMAEYEPTDEEIMNDSLDLVTQILEGEDSLAKSILITYVDDGDTNQGNRMAASTETENSRNLIIFPNPATKSFTLELGDFISLPTKFFINEIDGKIALEGILTQSISEISISNLANGIYFLVIDDSQKNKYYYFKLVKY